MKGGRWEIVLVDFTFKGFSLVLKYKPKQIETQDAEDFLDFFLTKHGFIHLVLTQSFL